MKRWMMITMVALFVLPLGQAWALGGLSADQDRLAFGSMKEGVVAQKVVTLTNTGDAVIEIKNVSTS